MTKHEDTTQRAAFVAPFERELGAGAGETKRGAMHALRRLARALGWSTSYHVAATYNRDSHIGFSVISMTVSVRPWLHADNYSELVAYVKTQAERPVGTPSITSITKLGA